MQRRLEGTSIITPQHKLIWVLEQRLFCVKELREMIAAFQKQALQSCR